MRDKTFTSSQASQDQEDLKLGQGLTITLGHYKGSRMQCKSCRDGGAS